MKRLIFVWLLLFATLFAGVSDTEVSNDSTANPENSTAVTSKQSESSSEKVMFLSYEKLPSRVLKGEILKVTIKVQTATNDFTDLVYETTGAVGLKLLNENPSREIDSKYYYDTFYFLVTSSQAKLPNFEASLVKNSDKDYPKTTLVGEALNVVSLNPKSDFANILADSFEVLSYKTTSYDTEHNIIVFIAAAKNCDIASFKLKNVFKQGTESVSESYQDSKITYYAIINKKIDKFSFSYFNLKENKFMMIEIPIVVNDDSVTTQSDLKPIDHSHEQLKMSLATILALVIFFVVIWKKKLKYLALTLIPITYIAFLAVPTKDVCIKKGSSVYLLPVAHGTIFETTTEQYNLSKEGKTKNWTKVQLNNKKIGWVKDENICSN